MRIIAAALVAGLAGTARGGALAQPFSPDEQIVVDRQIAIASSLAKMEKQPDLIKYADAVEDAIRQFNHRELGGFYPCIPGKDITFQPPGRNYTITGKAECLIAVGQGALQQITWANATIAYGRCSGAHVTTESRDLLIGDYTAAPPGRNGFVNIDNQICFWRDTGSQVDCPLPEPECVGEK